MHQNQQAFQNEIILGENIKENKSKKEEHQPTFF
jgi:hypothetical protein